jgi:hypothetical protein
MLEVHHGDVVSFSLLGFALYFQLAGVAIIMGGLLIRRLGPAPKGLRLALLASCGAFLWPLSYYSRWSAWKAALPCLVIALAALLLTSTIGARGRRSIAVVLILAGLGSAALMVFNDVFY